MSLESVIDQIATQLAKQRRRSVTQLFTGDGPPKLHCMYRGSEGSMCAVGCLIPDELYDPKLDQWGTVYNILVQERVKTGWTPVYRDHLYSLLPELDPDQVYEVLRAFQYWHDIITFPDESRYGVHDAYSDLLIKQGNATDEELKAAIVATLTTVAASALNPNPETSNVP